MFIWFRLPLYKPLIGLCRDVLQLVRPKFPPRRVFEAARSFRAAKMDVQGFARAFELSPARLLCALILADARNARLPQRRETRVRPRLKLYLYVLQGYQPDVLCFQRIHGFEKFFE